MTYNVRRVRKFLHLLSKYENKHINNLVEHNAYLSFKQMDPDVKEDDLRDTKLSSLQLAVEKLENKLRRVKRKRDDTEVKRLERNIERLKGKIKRIEKP